MFSKLSDVQSYGELVRFCLVWLCAGILAPAGLLALLATGFLMAPVACVALPFMCGAFFGSASHERKDAMRRASLHPRATRPVLAG